MGWDRKAPKKAAKADKKAGKVDKKFEKCTSCKPPNKYCSKHLKQSKSEAGGWISAEDNPAVHRRWDGTPT